jgi:hypothetical protein
MIDIQVLYILSGYYIDLFIPLFIEIEKFCELDFLRIG